LSRTAPAPRFPYTTLFRSHGATPSGARSPALGASLRNTAPARVRRPSPAGNPPRSRMLTRDLNALLSWFDNDPPHPPAGTANSQASDRPASQLSGRDASSEPG